ncbi:MAG: 4-hydroxy-tetrahydrodipicolinate reductase [Actinobacteria bacterium]|nr:4-hydroxy-tetrahydrodipicolinate reductase [Actinomycetota bacterium]
MRIGVCGAGGRMGREVCRAVVAETDMELVCAVDPAWEGKRVEELAPGTGVGLKVSADIGELERAGAEAMVDFSVAEAARNNVVFALSRGIHCVVGTTGFEAEDLDRFSSEADRAGVGCLVAPNFAVGAVLMMDFARRAARHMEACEIVELHHPAKLDAPSGTARMTARLVGGEEISSHKEPEGGGPRGIELHGVRVHSVRLPGLVAHQEVIFGGRGQTLTIRHDSYDRTSFMPGVILALRRIRDFKGLVLGLDKVMDL